MNLKEFRKLNGMTQDEVAEAIGVPKKTYQNYEREVRDPDSDVLCALADLYGVSLDELVRGVVDPNHNGSDAKELADDQLPADERELLAAYRNLSKYDREIALRMIKAI